MFYVFYFFSAVGLILLPSFILALHWDETKWYHGESFLQWIAWHKCQACFTFAGMLLGISMLVVH